VPLALAHLKGYKSKFTTEGTMWKGRVESLQKVATQVGLEASGK